MASVGPLLPERNRPFLEITPLELLSRMTKALSQATDTSRTSGSLPGKICPSLTGAAPCTTLLMVSWRRPSRSTTWIIPWIPSSFARRIVPVSERCGLYLAESSPLAASASMSATSKVIATVVGRTACMYVFPSFYMESLLTC